MEKKTTLTFVIEKHWNNVKGEMEEHKKKEKKELRTEISIMV